MIAGRGDDLPVSADAGRRHLPVRHRGFEKRNIADSRAGVGAGPLHPVRPMQLRLPAQRHPRQVLRRGRARRRAGRLQVGADQRARLSRRALHAAVLSSRTAPAAASASRSARRTARASPGVQGHQPRGQGARSWSRSAPTSPSSRRCRSTTARGSISPTCAACSSCSRCSSSPAPAPAAARRRI